DRRAPGSDHFRSTRGASPPRLPRWFRRRQLQCGRRLHRHPGRPRRPDGRLVRRRRRRRLRDPTRRPASRPDPVGRRCRPEAAASRRLPARVLLVHLAGPLRLGPATEPVRDGGCAMTPPKQIHLAAHFPGVNNTTVWSDPESGSQTDFASFVHLAQTAERGKFDFFFLAEGLRLREHRGQIFDLDVVARPDSLPVLAALATVPDRIGLAATLNPTFNEPYDLARQFATLDHLSGGRAAWNAVTSPDAFTGENFRRGGFLERSS